MIQINRLEQDLGHPMLERAERGRAMKPTPFRTRVAAAIRKSVPVVECEQNARQSTSPGR
ncbi:hypothetical protein [Streptomyces sp. NPDC048196]|uniref:hypothetical protein n=1 Tax=Streptomyces sp. NPDC048196 TaxID=3154712 RepID=UPI0033E58AE5